jgi:hypothetical protein
VDVGLPKGLTRNSPRHLRRYSWDLQLHIGMNRLVPWTRKTGLFCRPHHLIRWTAEPPDQLKARKKRLALARIRQAFTFPFLSVYADFSDRSRIASEENSEPGFFLEANSSPILIPHRTAKTKKEQITCLNSLQAAALKLHISVRKKRAICAISRIQDLEHTSNSGNNFCIPNLPTRDLNLLLIFDPE